MYQKPRISCIPYLLSAYAATDAPAFPMNLPLWSLCPFALGERSLLKSRDLARPARAKEVKFKPYREILPLFSDDRSASFTQAHNVLILRRGSSDISRWRVGRRARHSGGGCCLSADSDIPVLLYMSSAISLYQQDTCGAVCSIPS